LQKKTQARALQKKKKKGKVGDVLQEGGGGGGGTIAGQKRRALDASQKEQGPKEKKNLPFMQDHVGGGPSLKRRTCTS